jgi:hypothetical protein
MFLIYYKPEFVKKKVKITLPQIESALWYVEMKRCKFITHDI